MTEYSETRIAQLRNAKDGAFVDRFVRDICRMHDSLRYSGLAKALEGVDGVHVVERHGITTVVARTCDIPHRYLLGISGFRLSQYVRVGFMSGVKTAASALFCEPLDTMNPDDWHVVCLDGETGEILGYVELASNGGSAEPVRNNPRRKRFPVEDVHGIDIFDVVDAPHDLSTENVREVKRMMHKDPMKDRRTSYRVSLELILGLQWVCASTTPTLRAVVGDAEAHVALRHIIGVGLSPTVVTGTEPVLPEDDLLYPCYQIRTRVEPFYGVVPGPTEFARRRKIGETVITETDIMTNLRLLVAEDMKSTVSKVSVLPEAMVV